MGFEYRLSVTGATSHALGEAMSAVSRLDGAFAVAERIEFRSKRQGGVPDATVTLEGLHVYFCEHGVNGRDYLGQLVAVLVSRLGPIIVGEYE